MTGWDGKGRLLCSGLRFATVKTATSSYGPLSWPYPFPCVTTKPDLSNTGDLVKQAGTFGLYEQLVDGAALAKTGVVALNNGYFGAISLYDPEPVNQVICRRDENWVGVYLEPASSKSIVLSRRLVFPLSEKPMSQTTALRISEKASQVKASVEGDRLVLTGPVLHGAAILIPKATGLKPGSVISSETDRLLRLGLRRRPSHGLRGRAGGLRRCRIEWRPGRTDSLSGVSPSFLALRAFAIRSLQEREWHSYPTQ